MELVTLVEPWPYVELVTLALCGTSNLYSLQPFRCFFQAVLCSAANGLRRNRTTPEGFISFLLLSWVEPGCRTVGGGGLFLFSVWLVTQGLLWVTTVTSKLLFFYPPLTSGSRRMQYMEPVIDRQPHVRIALHICFVS